ncbi:tigger transposable element-derived protein 4 [Nomia melanderi]|uniref:tigger transposable element-derived protein 4 n=1 Tax=Nomia melanderi TaxID=2448451 RepID=UPI003FCDAC67
MREKLLQRSSMKTMKENLFRWCCVRRAMSKNLDMQLLREKAIELKKTLGLSDFKCSTKWIRNFLKEHKISTDSTNQRDPVFSDYRDWIDMMRSTIVRYKHSDLFHVDELGMYSDVVPSRISSASRPEGDGSPRNRVTILMGCNSSGTTKLPLLICGPYPSRTTTRDHVYCRSEDSSISDELFRVWLTAVNDRLSRSDRSVLLFLRRSRARAVRDLRLSHVNLVYLPGDFPTTLRPLRRDVFHYVKMIFRRRYAERLKRRTPEWNLRDILESLIDAWETVPREIVVCSFQRTRFRTDDRFLQIDCDCWDSLQTGVSFKRFVTFDDDLSDEPASSRYHSYNLRTSHSAVVQINEEEPSSINSKNLTPSGDQNLDDDDQAKQQIRLSEDPIVEAGKLGRSFWEAQFPGKRGVTRSEAFKRNILREESTGVAGSVQAIIDEALSLTTTAKADYTRKLIDSIYASKEPKSSGTLEPNDVTSTATRESSREDTLSENAPAVSESIEEACTSRGAPDGTSDARQGMSDGNLKLMLDGQDVSGLTNRKRRMSLGSGDDTDSESGKKVKTDWSKQFENTFVFGPPGSEQDQSIVSSKALCVSPRN